MIESHAAILLSTRNQHFFAKGEDDGRKAGEGRGKEEGREGGKRGDGRTYELRLIIAKPATTVLELLNLYPRQCVGQPQLIAYERKKGDVHVGCFGPVFREMKRDDRTESYGKYRRETNRRKSEPADERNRAGRKRARDDEAKKTSDRQHGSFKLGIELTHPPSWLLTCHKSEPVGMTSCLMIASRLKSE